MPSCVFGPVPSRRLGRSLGVDPVPFKTCTYDCIYCQLGRTTRQTIERKEWVPLGDLLGQLGERLDSGPDYVTLSGSGEPTLYSRLGELVEGIRRLTSKPIAVLTNGSLLGRGEVMESLRRVDLVVPSLDVGDARLFQLVNRPHPAIEFEAMVDGLVRFRETYPGSLWLEVLLVGGITDTVAEVEKIAALARKIRPDRVQLNTVTRPPCEHLALPVPIAALERLARLFGQRGEVITERASHRFEADAEIRFTELLDLVARRPCTVQDIANGLGIHPAEAAKQTEELERNGRIERVVHGRDLYFRTRSSPPAQGPTAAVGRETAEVVLVPDVSHCIEAVARSEYQKCVAASLRPEPQDPAVGIRLQILKGFLEQADFPRLRRESEPLIRASRPVRFRVVLAGERAQWRMES